METNKNYQRMIEYVDTYIWEADHELEAACRLQEHLVQNYRGEFREKILEYVKHKINTIH